MAETFQEVGQVLDLVNRYNDMPKVNALLELGPHGEWLQCNSSGKVSLEGGIVLQALTTEEAWIWSVSNRAWFRGRVGRLQKSEHEVVNYVSYVSKVASVRSKTIGKDQGWLIREQDEKPDPLDVDEVPPLGLESRMSENKGMSTVLFSTPDTKTAWIWSFGAGDWCRVLAQTDNVVTYYQVINDLVSKGPLPETPENTGVIRRQELEPEPLARPSVLPERIQGSDHPLDPLDPIKSEDGERHQTHRAREATDESQTNGCPVMHACCKTAEDGEAFCLKGGCWVSWLDRIGQQFCDKSRQPAAAGSCANAPKAWQVKWALAEGKNTPVLTQAAKAWAPFAGDPVSGLRLPAIGLEVESTRFALSWGSKYFVGDKLKILVSRNLSKVPGAEDYALLAVTADNAFMTSDGDEWRACVEVITGPISAVNTELVAQSLQAIHLVMQAALQPKNLELQKTINAEQFLTRIKEADLPPTLKEFAPVIPALPPASDSISPPELRDIELMPRPGSNLVQANFEIGCDIIATDAFGELFGSEKNRAHRDNKERWHRSRQCLACVARLANVDLRTRLASWLVAAIWTKVGFAHAAQRKNLQPGENAYVSYKNSFVVAPRFNMFKLMEALMDADRDLQESLGALFVVKNIVHCAASMELPTAAVVEAFRDAVVTAEIVKDGDPDLYREDQWLGVRRVGSQTQDVDPACNAEACLCLVEDRSEGYLAELMNVWHSNVHFENLPFLFTGPPSSDAMKVRSAEAASRASSVLRETQPLKDTTWSRSRGVTELNVTEPQQCKGLAGSLAQFADGESRFHFAAMLEALEYLPRDTLAAFTASVVDLCRTGPTDKRVLLLGELLYAFVYRVLDIILWVLGHWTPGEDWAKIQPYLHIRVPADTGHALLLAPGENLYSHDSYKTIQDALRIEDSASDLQKHIDADGKIPTLTDISGTLERVGVRFPWAKLIKSQVDGIVKGVSSPLPDAVGTQDMY
uniref:Uncharacterized protein n=1 Tax=Zooxanthella nutricula TaxID=1333877 RepID=A0A7S2L1G2_9DINO